jgi:hypothetical protein
MIVSHKHKFIFVKTHKTSTQTFMKFIKPHLGVDDVMAGDPPNYVNENTKVNVDKIFESTGKSALSYQEKYGNHLPWFIIKEIVGDEIWESYTKFTIERDPKDRLVSLFCFLNSILIQPGLFQPSPAFRSRTKGPEIKAILENSVLDLYPEEVRDYFEETTLLQLKSDELDLTSHDTYGVKGVEMEREIYKKKNKELGYRVYEVDDVSPIINNKLGFFPYLNTEDICIRLEPFQKHQATEGQCRFLNYGYYHDGSEIKVDKVINFNDTGNDIGNFFKEFDINIKCNKQTYDDNSQNVHYRKNKNTKPTNWWFDGKKSQEISKYLDKKFLFLNDLL